MAKKKNVSATEKNIVPNTKKNVPPVAAAVKSLPQKKTHKENLFTRYSDISIVSGVAIIVFLCLKTCLNNQFTNWDDPGYIKDNKWIKDVTAEGIKNIFTYPVMGNYHPLTILSYAIEYSYVRLQPWLYHLDSLLFHVAVTILVYWFVKLLTNNSVAAKIAALFFGLHPMHIESVAWLAGRKDVVYGMFYMGSCIAYIYYIRALKGGKTYIYYCLSLILFLCSLLSKPVAVSLPVTLLLLDYWENRKWNVSLLIEKIPLFLIAVGFGIKSVLDQRSFKALATLDVSFNIFERFTLGCYALVNYLIKALVPIQIGSVKSLDFLLQNLGLSNFYPYPEKVNNILPFVYYSYLVIVAALIFLVWKYARKNKIVMFGLLFFLANIVLLLQFLPVGGAILADRYSYIPYLGLIFIPVVYISKMFPAGSSIEAYFTALKSLRGTQFLLLAVTVAYLFFFGWLSNDRCTDWRDTISLWRDEAQKHPNVPSAFNNLGFEYFNLGNVEPDAKRRTIDFDSATVLLKEAIRLTPTFVNPWVSLGEIARTKGNFDEAKYYYYKALSLNKADEAHNALLGLAIIYCITGQQEWLRRQPDGTYDVVGNHQRAAYYFDSAHYCFHTAIQLTAYFPEAHSNYGNYFDMMRSFDTSKKGYFDSSYREYSLSIEQNPDMYASYLNRARLLQRNGKLNEALKDFEKSIEVGPDMGETYYARSTCYFQLNNKKQALNDVEKARSLGYTQIDGNYYQQLKK